VKGRGRAFGPSTLLFLYVFGGSEKSHSGGIGKELNQFNMIDLVAATWSRFFDYFGKYRSFCGAIQRESDSQRCLKPSASFRHIIGRQFFVFVPWPMRQILLMMSEDAVLLPILRHPKRQS
jgi:hypothetical protein